MVHPFLQDHVVTGAEMPTSAGAVVVGADGTVANTTGELTTTAKIGIFTVACAFLYFLGHKNGRIEGYVKGAEHGEFMALQALKAHQAVHATRPFGAEG